jgi:hypothetical protein
VATTDIERSDGGAQELGNGGAQAGETLVVGDTAPMADGAAGEGGTEGGGAGNRVLEADGGAASSGNVLAVASAQLSRRLSGMVQSLMQGDGGELPVVDDDLDGAQDGERGTHSVAPAERRPSGSHAHPLHIDETLEEELEAHPEESVESVEFLPVTAIVHRDGEQEALRRARPRGEGRPSGSHTHPLHIDETLEEELEAHPEESVESVEFLPVTAIVHRDGEQEALRRARPGGGGNDLWV